MWRLTIYPFAVIPSRRNGHGWPGAQRRQRLEQQGTAGHPVGVIVAADRQRFLIRAGPADPLNSNRQIRKLALRIRQFRGVQQIEGLLFGCEPTPHQQAAQGQGKIASSQGIGLDHRR